MFISYSNFDFQIPGKDTKNFWNRITYAPRMIIRQHPFPAYARLCLSFRRTKIGLLFGVTKSGRATTEHSLYVFQKKRFRHWESGCCNGVFCFPYHAGRTYHFLDKRNMTVVTVMTVDSYQKSLFSILLRAERWDGMSLLLDIIYYIYFY